MVGENRESFERVLRGLRGLRGFYGETELAGKPVSG